MEPKNSTESPRRVLVLLGLAAVLVGVLAWEWWPEWGTVRAPLPVRAPSVAQPEKESTGAVDLGARNPEADQGAHPLASLALDQLRDTIERPLFEKSRRPVAPAPVTVVPTPPITAPPPADLNALSLQGIVLDQGGSAIALLRRSQTGQSLRVQEGDMVDGWTVVQIEAERVHLVQGSTRITLHLFRKR
jgi:hypothetical protein